MRPRNHICACCCSAAARSALGAVFVFVSLLLVARGDCGEPKRSPPQTRGINALRYRKTSRDAAHGPQRGERTFLWEDLPPRPSVRPTSEMAGFEFLVE